MRTLTKNHRTKMRHLFATLLTITTCMIASALPTAVKNRTFFEGITYSWPYNADPSVQQQSNLGEVATDPDQIIAMLREVYMNKSIPGNYARGYSAKNTNEGTWTNGVASGNYPVAYSGIGNIGLVNGNYGYIDTGWGLSGNTIIKNYFADSETVTFDASVDKSSNTSLTKRGFIIRYVNNLNASLGWYLMSYGYDHRFATAPGNIMTNVAFTFTAAGYGSSNIDYVRYRNSEGRMVRIDRSTTPNLTDFMPAGGTTFVWTIPTDSLVIRAASNQNLRATRIEATYEYQGFVYFARDSYVPNQEGNTVLLVEVNDNLANDGVWANTLEDMGLATFVDKTTTTNGVTTTSHLFDHYNITDYASLRAVIAATIKSARILTDAIRVGSDYNVGTLFKIDADKLNRFFLLGKGQLRWINNDYNGNDVTASPTPRAANYATTNQPYFLNGAYYDTSNEALFNHMFEQFSPTLATGGEARNDIYRDLVNMENFSVMHDCRDVLTAETSGHEFNMYGKTSETKDCQDVRDMMFFVPDHRMYKHSTSDINRDPNSAQKYVYYHTKYSPKIGLYTIKLKAITGTKQSNANVFDLKLSWTSNILDFLPGQNAKYELLRVTTDANGNKTYTQVAELNPNTVTYTDQVPMEENAQIVTYVVRGQDSNEFLSLQLSNEESFVVPGTDVSESLKLQLNADYYSRFDPQLEQNNYSNLISLGNGSTAVTNIKKAQLDGNHLFTFTRSYTDDDGENHTEVIATATANTSTKKLTIVMQNQNKFTYGYHQNGTTEDVNPTFTVSFTSATTSGVTFGNNFKFYDNFSVPVTGNKHPNKYTYQLLFQFDNNEKYAYSNTMSVYVHKTSMDMEPEGGRAVSRDDVDGDLTRSLPANGTVDFDIDVKYSSKKEILRYDAYRWPEGATRYIIEPTSPTTAEQDVPPTGIAGNQGDRYTVAMNADNFLYTGETTTLGDEQTATQAHFVDNYVRDAAGIYTYVPVIEVFPPNESRSDYNTYGAPLQQAATGTVAVSERTSYTQTDNGQDTYPQKSSYTWQDADGTLCAYYTFLLNLDADIPNGYDLYKVRAWRQMDTEFQYEELANRNFRKGSDVLFAEYTFPDYTKDSNTYWPIGAGDPMQSVSNQGGKVVGEMAGTFGAIDVTKANGGQGIDIPITFVVRAYYTREANMADLNTISGNSPRRLDAVNEADGKYYVLEKTIVTTLKGTEGDNQIVTALTDAVADVREVADVTYHNMTGAASKRPFDGVNIKVTRYTDGSTMTKKVLIK